MKNKRVTKGIVAIFSSLVYLAGFGLFIRNVGQSLFGSSGGLGDILFPFMLSALGCFILGWFNSRSLGLASLGVFITFFVGIPLTYLFLSPATESIVKIVMPNTNLMLSGSFSAIWFVLVPVTIIELVTANVIQHKRWITLAIGIVISLLFMWGTETLTSNLGQNSRLDIVRLVVYAPVTWCLIVLSVSYKREMKNDYKNV